MSFDVAAVTVLLVRKGTGQTRIRRHTSRQQRAVLHELMTAVCEIPSWVRLLVLEGRVRLLDKFDCGAMEDNNTEWDVRASSGHSSLIRPT